MSDRMLEEIDGSVQQVVRAIYDTSVDLRDRFAMAAIPVAEASLAELTPWDFELIAKRAYELADAMMKAREPKVSE